MLGLEAVSRSRLAPAPSKRSRMHDTPVRDHVAGAGPFGGSVSGLAVAHSRPVAVYVALRGGGVYRSSDRGDTWQPADRGLPAYGCSALVADPVDGSTLYAECGDGLFKTVDGGALWRQLDIDNPYAPIISPANPQLLYQPGGALRSRDGGRRWTAVKSTGRVPRCEGGLVVDPADAAAFYCVTESGLLFGRDGQRYWRRTRFPHAARISGGVAVPGASNRLLAVTDDGGVYQVTSRGDTWMRLGSLPSGPSATDLASDQSGSIVYARQDERLVRSDDGGASWLVLPGPWPQHSFWAYALDPLEPRVVYVATSAGPYVSSDAGHTWHLRTRGLTRATATVVVHEGPRSVVFASVGAEVLTSDDGGTTWSGVRNDTFAGAIDPRSLVSDGDGGVLLSAGSRSYRLKAGAATWVEDVVPDDVHERFRLPTPLGALRRVAAKSQFHYARDGGTTWHLAALPAGVAPTGVVAVDRESRQLVASIGGVWAIGAGTRNSLWRSLDGGASWTRTFEPPVSIAARCCDLIPDPHETDTVYAVITGTAVGGGGADVLRSVDAGVTWTPLTSLVGGFVAVPTRPATLLGQDYVRGVVRSRDGGAQWAPSGEGLPPDVEVTGFTFDRRDPTTVFASTDSRGVYRSKDGGASWRPTGHDTHR